MTHSLRSTKGILAVLQPKFQKAETQIKGGLALISQRTETILIDLAMDFQASDGTLLVAKRDKVILRGDAGLTAWAKKIYSLGATEFVLCPEAEVLGFAIENIEKAGK